MSRPFPGVIPYLEDPAFWQDFHRDFITELRRALVRELPEHYDARMEESLRLIDDRGEERHVSTRFPDVTISTAKTSASSILRSNVSVADPEVVEQVEFDLEEVRDVWIEVRHRPSTRIVTILEVLSPANKTGLGWHEYDRKRKGIIGRQINLVELDFLIEGERIATRKPLNPADYFAFITRAVRPDQIEVRRWNVGSPLPELPVPLLLPDPDILISLESCMGRSWEASGYERVLDFARRLPIEEQRRAEVDKRVDAWRAGKQG